MSPVYLSEERRLRFPNRGPEFTHGVEVGMVAALMDLGHQRFERRLSEGNLDQVRALAEKMGFELEEGEAEEGFLDCAFQPRRARPRLRLVHSADPAVAEGPRALA